MNAVTQANTSIQPTHLGQAAAAQPATVANTPAAPLPAQLQPAAPHQLPANVNFVRNQMTSAAPLAPNNLATNTNSLKKPQPHMLASNGALLDKLEAHANAGKCDVTRAEIQAFVSMGEHIVKSLQTPAQGAARLLGNIVTTVHPPVQFAPNMESARAVSWYVAACAAQQDINQASAGQARTISGSQVTDLTTKGSYVLKDPNNVIFNFLAASPLTYQRISTHFNEESATPINSNGKLLQSGIEDYQRKLPGEGGAMLFDRLTGAPGQERLFLKLEHTGYPPLSNSKSLFDNPSEGTGGIFHAFIRKAKHATSFLNSLFGGAGGVDRKEHIHKGMLENTIYRPFLALMEKANALGLSSTSLKQHQGDCKKLGLPHVEQSFQLLLQALGQIQNPSAAISRMRIDIHNLQAVIQHTHQQLGAQSNHLQMERRGGETHVDTHVQVAQQQQQLTRQLHQQLQTLTGKMALPQGSTASGTHVLPGLNRNAGKDWDRGSGVTINGTNFPPAPGGTGANLPQAAKALVQACGGNTIAADWISRFAHQDSTTHVMEFLAQLNLGNGMSGWQLPLEQSFNIRTLANGSVELDIGFSFQASKHPKGISMLNNSGPVPINSNAQLSGNVTLRFDFLQFHKQNSPPVPVISQGIQFTHSGF